VARGGKRAGAGRKPGAATAKTREIADKAAEEGVTPLEVMLGAMRELWDNGNKQDAAQIAKDAAPYMHPRLSNIDLKAEHDVTNHVLSGEPIDDPEKWAAEFEEALQAGMVPPGGAAIGAGKVPG
jgi:hypothetical protein